MILLTNSAPPKLHVSRPTSTTVCFTVSTRPSADTVPKKALLYSSHAVRLGLGVLILALFWTKWRSYFPLPDNDDDASVSWERALLTNRVGVMVAWAAEGMDWRALVVGGLAGLWGVVRRGYTGMVSQMEGRVEKGSRRADLFFFFRGIAARAERPRCADVQFVADVPFDGDD